MTHPRADALRRSIAFTAVATALALPLAAGFWWSAHGGPSWVGPLCTIAYMATPLITAVGFVRRDGHSLGERLAFRLTRRWAWLGAWLVPVAVGFGAAGITFLLPGVSFDPHMGGVLARLDDPMRAAAEAQIASLPPPQVLLPLLLMQALVAGTTLNAVAAYGEEAGWRGWMHVELAPLGFWPRALLTGVLWGLWHAPLILQGYNYPEHPVLGVAFMVAMCVGLSGPMAELRDRTDSALAAAVFHGTFNATAGVSLLYAVGGSDLLVGVTGAAGLAVLAMLNVGLELVRRRGASEGVVQEL
jgi:membrane protease YdiL (CAAX protease family)